MSGLSGKLRPAAAIGLIGLLAGCFAARVHRHVADPEPYFRRALRRIERIHRNDPDRRGCPGELHLLVYDRSEKELVQAAAPFWLVDRCMSLGEYPQARKAERELRDRYDFDWHDMRGLHEVGPGLLVSIEDEESKILIWVE
jgi:hypothetical protein